MFGKYLVKTLFIRCSCYDGRYYPDTGGFNSNCDLSEPCRRCKGTRLITIDSKHHLFKEEYKEFVKKTVERLTTECRQANKIARDLGNELGKYCEEYNKLINKND